MHRAFRVSLRDNRMSYPTPRCSVSRWLRGEQRAVRRAGQASAPQAKHVLTAAGSVGREEVEVDLEDLSFCDAAGLRVFEEARQHCAENGGLLVLTDPRPLLRHVLAITGLTHLLLDR